MIHPSILVEELKTFFATQSLPPEIQLKPAHFIHDVPKFVASHLAIASLNDPKGINDQFLIRLRTLRDVLLAEATAK